MNKSVNTTTPQSVADKKLSTSEKKLIQARLPFQVLSSSTGTVGSPTSKNLELRKRKLSYTDEIISSPNPKQTKLGASTKLENLNDIDLGPVIISDDESISELEKDNDNYSEFENLNNSATQTKSVNKLTIKLPLNSKKRKKYKPLNSKRLEVSDTSDPEKLLEDNARFKKTKITGNTIDSSDNTIISSHFVQIPHKEILHYGELKKDFEKTQIPNKSIANNISTQVTDHGVQNDGNETKLVLSQNEEIDENRKVILCKSPELLLIQENTAINQNIRDSCSFKINTSSPTSNKITEERDLEIEKRNKKEIEDQKRKEKEEQRRKEKLEKEDFKKKEKEEKEEIKRKEKEEKEVLKRKEKEEKERKRMAELEIRNEEKRLKDDEKRKKDEQKEEEKRKRDDEKRKKELEKEEAENKKRKAAEAFTNFFQKKKIAPKFHVDQVESLHDSCNVEYRAFMPFQVKGDMKLAPLNRKQFNDIGKIFLDETISGKYEVHGKCQLYLNLLKTGKCIAYKFDKRQHVDSNDVFIIEDELLGVGQSINECRKLDQSNKAKYFHFRENRRPPYYGTWMKKSILIGPRTPFAQDKSYFDYEIDSDDEWEEEEPGESLHGTEDEKESEDEYEVDNDFFVPHGHLSDEEIQNDDEVDQDNSPQCQKAKLKILQQEFTKEMKKKTEKIRPRLIGIVWVDNNGKQPNTCPNTIWESLNKCAMILCSGSTLIIEPDNNSLVTGSPMLKDKKQSKRNELPEELIADLIHLIHCNIHKKSFLIHEFQAFLDTKFKSHENAIKYSKAVIRDKIDKISKWTISEDKNSLTKKKKLCRMVTPETLRMYGLENISNTNIWNYNLPPISKLLTNSNEKTHETKKKNHDNKTVDQNNSKGSSNITIFTKVMSKNENSTPVIKNQNNNTSSDVIKDNSVYETKVVKKRVPLLMSVPIGQAIPETFKNELISSFLKKEKETAIAKNISETTKYPCPVVEADSVIIID